MNLIQKFMCTSCQNEGFTGSTADRWAFEGRLTQEILWAGQVG
jgi:hypothetical protein